VSVARVTRPVGRLHDEEARTVDRNVERPAGRREGAVGRVELQAAVCGVNRALQRSIEGVALCRRGGVALALIPGRSDVGDVGREPVEGVDPGA
jgi:hypothetical protein